MKRDLLLAPAFPTRTSVADLPISTLYGNRLEPCSGWPGPYSHPPAVHSHSDVRLTLQTYDDADLYDLEQAVRALDELGFGRTTPTTFASTRALRSLQRPAGASYNCANPSLRL